MSGLLFQCRFSGNKHSCACTLLNNYSSKLLAWPFPTFSKTNKQTNTNNKLQSVRVTSCSPLLLWGGRKNLVLAPVSDTLFGFVWIGMKLALSRSARTQVRGKWIPFKISSKRLQMVGNKKLFAFQKGYVVFPYRITHAYHVKICGI